MAYVKSTFENNKTTLTAEHMNSLQDSISEGYSFRPYVELGNLNDNGSISTTYTENLYHRTARFLHPTSTDITLKTNVDCVVKVFCYDRDFQFIGSDNWIACAANTNVNIKLLESCIYIKMLFSGASNTSYEEITMTEEKTKYGIDATTGAIVASTSSSGYVRLFDVEDSWELYATGYAPSNNAYTSIGYFDNTGASLGTEQTNASGANFDKWHCTVPSGTTQVAIQSSTSGSGRNAPALFKASSSSSTVSGGSALTAVSAWVDGVSSQDFYNPRPSDEGYIHLTIPVNVADATASDTGDWKLKDNMNILADHGLLVLPKTYSNIGKPTRLIIYAHGAGVNYSSSQSRFPSSDCLPAYWLAEGYAVMDIEGNPFNDTDEHFYTPQARQSYENAYNWVIENFNICRDGVFAGGRSMGGGMTFELMQSHIPVLAACPVVPACNGLWYHVYCDAARKRYLWGKLGFTGTMPTLTSSKNLSEAEIQYMYNNFDKLVKYNPLLRGITDLPDKDTLFATTVNVKGTVAEVPEETALYSKLHFDTRNIPVKIFASKEDTSVPYQRNCVLMEKMIKNAGGIVELRLFSTDTSDAHHFEFKDSRAFIDHTTIYGETIHAPLVYVEMLQFWRRYEKTL